jgi:hypothetical protein
LTEGIDFGMSLAELLVPALADDNAIANDDGPDHRIGLNPPAAACGEFEC